MITAKECKEIKRNTLSINLLKTDTQETEDEVLKGCVNALKVNIIDYVELELIIKGPYNKTLSFKDIENILNPFYNFYYYLTDHFKMVTFPFLMNTSPFPHLTRR